MEMFNWGAVLLPAVQRLQDFHFNGVAQDVDVARVKMQDFHFMAAVPSISFEAIAQDFHGSMSVPDAPEVALPAVQADTAEL